MADRIKVGRFLVCVLSAWAITAFAQEEDTVPQLKMDNILSLPETRGEPPAIKPEIDTTDGAEANELPAATAEPESADSVTTDEPPATNTRQGMATKETRPPKQRFTSGVTVGAAYAKLDNPSAQFGKFSGVTDSQFYMIGSASVQSRKEDQYWNLMANDISLDNQSVIINGGSSGNYKFHFGYSELANPISNNSQTPFDGAGGATLTLPTGFTRAAGTDGMTELAASMKNVDLGTKRKEGDASFAYELDKNFGLSFSFRRYLKDGIKSMGTVVKPDLAGPQGLILPEPVNYHTDEFRTSLDWHGERGQANVEYYYSRFNNNDASLTWDNPFDDTFPTPYPTQGRNSLPPDNQHQRLSLSSSFKLAAATRLSALLERGTMTQNDVFLPYTINSASTISTPMPRSSATAQIDTTLLKLDLTTQPLSALSLHAGYRHYDTDNKTPRDLYQMVVNDGGNQVAADSAAARYNQPFDYSQNQLALDSSYHFGHGTSLKLGFDLDQKDYRYRAVNSTRENTYSAKVNKRWDAVTAFVNLAYGRKRPDSYDQVRALEYGHSTDYLATVPSDEYFDNLPGLRQFDMAERNRQRQGLGVTWVARQDLNLGFHANRNQDVYNASQFGLQEQKTDNYTVDATLTPDEFQSWALYYTRQNMMWRQTSRAYDFFGKGTGAADPANDWSAQHQDAIDTIGINITLTFLDDQLPVQLSYAYSNINTDISFTANPSSSMNTLPSDMPTLKGRRQTIDLSGTYGIRDNLSVRAGILMETYRASDWATDGLPPGSPAISPDLLTLSGSAADYRAFVLSTAMNYHF